MKRLTLLLLGVMISGIAFSQNVKVQSAINYLKDLRLKEAKKAIDEAAQHEDTKNEPKTWLYKGKIYMQIHIVSTMDDAVEVGMARKDVERALGTPDKDRRRYAEYEPGMRIDYDDNDKVKSFTKPADGEYETLADNALMTAYDAYQKCITLDEDKEYLNAVKMELLRMGNLTYNVAVGAYNEKAYNRAEDYFMKTVKIKKIFGELDTNSIYNAAIAATNGDDYDRAVELYKELIKYNYNNPQIYTSTGQILMNKQDTAQAEEILKLGRKRFPDDYNVLITLTNIYLTRGDVQQSIEMLNLALEKQPDNAELYYNVGVVYDQSSKDTMLNDEKRAELFEEAVKNYKKAIELKKDYFDANYNLGALFFNNGVQLLSIANKLPLDAVEEYEKLKKQAEMEFEKALPYLEKAYSLRPEDQNTLLALKELYTRTKQYEKLKEINAKLAN